MNRIIVGLCIAASVVAVAQDGKMTQEQIKAKCEAEGGCFTISLMALMQVVQQEAEAAFKLGQQSCRNAI